MCTKAIKPWLLLNSHLVEGVTCPCFSFHEFWTIADNFSRQNSYMESHMASINYVGQNCRDVYGMVFKGRPGKMCNP